MNRLKHPVYIAIIWHMHQPYYKNLMDGDFVMPWVRLHGIKDYYGMARIMEAFPDVHMTFSLAPCLLEQIQDYDQRLEQDIFINLTLKPPEDLTADERVFILKNFFLANWDMMVKIYPRYGQLLQRRGHYFSEEELLAKQKYISHQDIFDIQMWHNLAWMDTDYKKKDERISWLMEKGKNFDKKDKEVMIRVQKEIMSKIIPEYKKIMEKGQAELIPTPYYHPILPLLCNMSLAKTSSPDIKLPKHVFSHPEDAMTQLSMGVNFHRSLFGKNPNGIWPSEGSVCQNLVPMLNDLGIKWLATDEDILSKSLHIDLNRNIQGALNNPAQLYTPYWIQNGDKQVLGVFRDRVLSDLIGFVYQRWNPEEAVDDFISRLHMIRQNHHFEKQPPLVTIVLDGENAWEFYPNNGRDFLARLYESISKDPDLKMVTISEYLEQFPTPQEKKIDSIFPGSWINHNFKIWIGHEEENTAWEFLTSARQAIEGYKQSHNTEKDQERLELALKEIYIAEGSDWFWWYGDDHFTEQADLFDHLFRKHLINIYNILDLKVPNELYLPIIAKRVKSIYGGQPQAFFTPTFDGRITSYFEWLPAVHFKMGQSGGSTHRSEAIITDCYYGFDEKNLYIRLDTSIPIKDLGLGFSLHFLSPKTVNVDINRDKQSGGFVGRIAEKDNENSNFHTIGELKSLSIDRIVEIGIPFDRIGVGLNIHIRFIVTMEKDGNEIERWPTQGYFLLKSPYPGYEEELWRP